MQVGSYKTLLTVHTVFTYYRREIQVVAPDMKLSIKTKVRTKIPYHTFESDFWKKHKINEVTELGKPKGNKAAPGVLMYLDIKY